MGRGRSRGGGGGRSYSTAAAILRPAAAAPARSHDDRPTTNDKNKVPAAAAAAAQAPHHRHHHQQQRASMARGLMTGFAGALGASFLFAWLTGHGRPFERSDLLYGGLGAAGGVGAAFLLKNPGLLRAASAGARAAGAGIGSTLTALRRVSEPTWKYPSFGVSAASGGVGAALGLCLNGGRIYEREQKERIRLQQEEEQHSEYFQGEQQQPPPPPPPSPPYGGSSY